MIVLMTHRHSHELILTHVYSGPKHSLIVVRYLHKLQHSTWSGIAKFTPRDGWQHLKMPCDHLPVLAEMQESATVRHKSQRRNLS